MIYNPGKINVDTGGTEITFENAGFKEWSVYPINGDITIEIYSGGGYSQPIYGFNSIPMGDVFGGTKIRIKAVSGTVDVAYCLKG